MAIQITQNRRVVENVTHSLEFRHADQFGGGFSFPCDEAGKVITEGMSPEALANLEACRDNPDGKLIAKGVSRWVDSYVEPAEAQCYCGATVYLDDPLDNECECGRCFNMSGQEVTPSWKCDANGNPYDDQ